MIEKNKLQLAKDSAGKAAADLVMEGMLVGLGTGSTAACFIAHLSKRCKQGLNIQAVATSQKSWDLALASGIPMVDINTLTTLDFTIDGADEIDPQKRMIKGGGGALLREKIVASMSRDMVVIVDETKLVDHLGTHPLPVEIVPFAYKATLHKLKSFGYTGVLRMTSTNQLYLTDNKNYIVDIQFKTPCKEPEKDELIIRSTPGVVETGFFFNLARRVIVGFKDGHIEFRS